MMIAHKEGGTTIVPFVIFGIIYAIIIVFGIVAFIIYFGEFDAEKSVPETSYEYSILHYSVPKGFIADQYNTDTFASYKTADMYCSFYVYEKSTGNYSTGKIENMFNSMQVENQTDSLIINGTYWTIQSESDELSRTYNLKAQMNNIEYGISFFYIIDEEHAYCEGAYEYLKNSLNFE